jgi:hypothetical protein
VDLLERELHGQLKEYDKPFIKLMNIVQPEDYDLRRAAPPTLAAGILVLAKTSLAHARKAYSALLLMPPSIAAVRFEQTLKAVKKRWTSSTPRYPVFYDLEKIWRRMAIEKPKTEEELRCKLLMSMRFFMFMRNIDAARTQRGIVTIQEKDFLFVQRKGRVNAELEQIPDITNTALQGLSPRRLYTEYIKTTASFPGRELFVSVATKGRPVRRAISASTVGGLTSRELRRLDVSPIFKPHSTKGATTSTLARLGLDVYSAASLAKVKSVDTFVKHYHRLQGGDNLNSVLEAALTAPQIVTQPPNPSHKKQEVSKSCAHKAFPLPPPSLSLPVVPQNLDRGRLVGKEGGRGEGKCFQSVSPAVSFMYLPANCRLKCQ